MRLELFSLALKRLEPISHTPRAAKNESALDECFKRRNDTPFLIGLFLYV